MSNRQTDLVLASHDWVASSADPAISQNRPLLKTLTRSGGRLRVLERALSKKMSFAIYGASQAGKSYLANALAKGPNERLILRIGDEDLRFDDQINPAGGQESTGLVTRLTLDKSELKHRDYPIKLRLMGISDLVKLNVNTFACDIIDDRDLELDAYVSFIDGKLRAIESGAGAKSTSSIDQKAITRENLYEIEDYCRKNFKQTIYIQALNRADFWTRIEALLASSGVPAVLLSFHLLWMDLERYNELFDLLIDGLQTLRSSETVYCQLESLVEETKNGRKRKQNSIINVKILQDLNEANETLSSVMLVDGSVVRIRPSILSALTAEIEFTISPPTHEFFNSADLLDFPGARSRKKQTLSGFKKDKGLPIDEFNRGKVAFLFDKYVSEFEISGMLLCVEGGPQEIVGLDELIDEWIAESHGAKPSERNGAPCTLFFVLTKFDLLFFSAHGTDEGPGRWEARIHSSLEEPFAGPKRSPRSNWVQQWNQAGPFKNTFWLRNPGFDFSQMVNYSGDPGKSPEREFRLDREGFLDSLRSSFVNSAVAEKYFVSPAKAWDEACRLNDGGVSYVLAQVTKVAQKEVRDAQLRSSMHRELADRRDDLVQYVIASNEDELLTQKGELAKTLIRRFNVLLQKERIGEFVTMMLLHEHSVRVFLERAKREREKSKMASRKEDDAVEGPADVPMDDVLAGILGDKTPSIRREPVSDESKDRSFFRDAVREFIDTWIENISESIGRKEVLNYLHLDRSFFVAFCAELKQAILNQKLDELAELVYRKAQVRTGTEHQRMWQQVSQFTAIMNDFIAYGTVPGREPSEVPLPGGRSMTVFGHSKSIAIDISEEADDYSLKFWRDWIVAMQSAVLRNMTLPGVDARRLAENTALSKIIQSYNDELRTLEEPV